MQVVYCYDLFKDNLASDVNASLLQPVETSQYSLCSQF